MGARVKERMRRTRRRMKTRMSLCAEYVLLKRWWWYWCMLCYICMYMESDPKPKESWHCH